MQQGGSCYVPPATGRSAAKTKRAPDDKGENLRMSVTDKYMRICGISRH